MISEFWDYVENIDIYGPKTNFHLMNCQEYSKLYMVEN